MIEPLNLDQTPYIPAMYQGPRSQTISLIVLHSGETNEGETAAEGMANYFASGATFGSAHICIDDDSVVRCAPDYNRTNGAGGVNDFALHIEQAGRANQSRADWTDDYSRAVIHRAAQAVSFWLGKFPYIRPVFLDAGQLRVGERNGITTHNEVSQVFAGNDGHWDPGPEYPMDLFLSELLQGDDDVVTDEDIQKIVGQVARWFTGQNDELNAAGMNNGGQVVNYVSGITAGVPNIKQVLEKLNTLGTGGTGGAPIDLDALATAVADKLAKRLKD